MLEHAPHRNHLLTALAKSDWLALLPRVVEVPLKPEQILHHPNRPIEHVYFVENGLVSVLARTDTDHSVETWLIGRDGLAGIPVLLGASISPHRRLVQVEGTALRISAADLREAMEESAGVRHVLLRYVDVVLTQAAQVGACNARHDVLQRLARSLLMAHDSLESDCLPLNHAILSRMLGVRRASITVGLGELAAAGIVALDRGHVLILDRGRLEAAACGCYQIIKAAHERFRIDLRQGRP